MSILGNDWITINEVCDYFGISRGFVYEHIIPNVCQHEKRNGMIIYQAFDAKELSDFISTQLEVYCYHTYIDLMDYSTDAELTMEYFKELQQMRNSGTDNPFFETRTHYTKLREMQNSLRLTLTPKGQELFHKHIQSSNPRKRIEPVKAPDRKEEIVSLIRDSILNEKKILCSMKEMLKLDNIKSAEIAYRNIYEGDFLIIQWWRRKYYLDNSKYAEIIRDSMACPVKVAGKLLQ